MLLNALVVLTLSADPVTAKTSAVPYVAVFLTPDDTVAEHSTGRLEVELADKLAKKGVPMVDIGARYPQPKTSAEEGETLIKEGKEAYDNLDMDAAIQKLTDGILWYVKHPELADAKALAEVFLFLGAAELQNGKKADASKEFYRAAVLDPDLKPDPKYFAADVQKSFTHAHTDIHGKHKGIVLFQSFPSGAQVDLDGKSHGLTPLQAMELPPGRHHVRVSRPGYVSAAKFPEVTSGSEIDVRLELQPLPAYASSVDLAKRLANRNNFDAKVLPPQAKQLGAEIGARFIVLGRVTTSKATNKVEVQVWDVETGDRLREVKFDGDEFGMSQAADTIRVWIDRPPAEVVVEARPNPVAQALKKPWVWAVAGAVVVGVGVGVAVAASAEPHRFNFITGIP